ncbi:alpha/beta fold hydrolase [Hephaestia sp. GCM10023244]|uniref:alpha/beta fold hydrolase n=1 Tax=unclassified Hephaestia TaxID=2631281 RepID=UPI00207712CC|nr:alpha/beta hydrolase [Hephaestia sp. MAHUQ-44]MCM8732496.1 alpha/beta hydrolase [Hephaestia sp. MAHUQ-44]
MAIITASDGTCLFYKDWGPRDAQPVMFHHGWPLSADDWDTQMLFFLQHGYRVIAHDRRGHGRSEQTDIGNDMSTYASDVASIVAALDLLDAVHIGHSTGGGEVVRYAADAKRGRIAKVVLIGAIPPLMLQSGPNPGGIPLSVFDGFRAALTGNRAQFYREVASGPFYGFNRNGAEVNQGLIDNWWRQGMSGGAKAQYDCIAAFSETDFAADLEAIDVPVLFLHGEDDQIVPIENSAAKAVRLVRDGRLKGYPGLSHGLFATHPELINADLLAFVQGD